MNVNIITPINQLGYGIVGTNIVKALKQINHSPCLFPLGPTEVYYADLPIIEEAVNNGKQNYSVQAPSVRIFHANDLSMHVGKGKHCGWPIFELTKFTDQELYQLRSMDVIFVCSVWAKRIMYRNHINVPTYTIPLGVDRGIFNEKNNSAPKDETIFFNAGKWEVRKGHDILAKAFNAAFTEDDSVKLIMHCHNPFMSQEHNRGWSTQYTNSKLGRAGKIVVSNDRLASQYDLARWMSVAHCGVFPSRAEGWNMEALELLSMGKHLIITDYSAHTQYCSEKNSRLITIDKLAPAYDKVWFNGEGQWAEFGNKQMEQLVEHLRAVHKARMSGELTLNAAGIETATSLSWTQTAEGLITYAG
jgi:hypothetical protein